jgi:cob(I)alamin adenosyltransferase
MNKSNKAEYKKTPRVGLNIFYYGKGKGKTTAAMGLAARAAGAGMNVFILQFVKAARPAKGKTYEGGEWPLSSEIYFFENTIIDPKSTRKIGKIKNAQIGKGFVGILGDKKTRAVHIQAAKEALAHAAKILKSGKYELVILDELISALELKLISQKEVIDLIRLRPSNSYLVYTGHDAFPKILAISDLVSEINMIKHPYYKGILAQKGIDF